MTIAASVALLFGISTAAQAQDESEAYNFVGVQAGAQATLTHYHFDRLITPQYALQFGRYFNDKVGARVHFQGYKINSGFQSDRFPFLTTIPCHGYSFKAVTGDLDMLVNLSNVINPNRSNNNVNWYGVVGFGVNYTWDTDDFNEVTSQHNGEFYYVGQQLCGDKHASFNGRLGTGVEVNLTDKLALTFEADANYKNDQFNYKFNDKCDWQLAAFVGLTYKLGKKAKKVEPIVEPVYATRVDTVWYDDTEYKTKVVTEEFTCDDHFQICKSQPVSESVINKVTDFMKTYKNVTVEVTGYADKGTGNPTINMKYSQQRAEAVAEALKAAGVPAEIMTVDWKGDTVQPFAENDENRAAIVKVSGETEQKYPVTVKKYRTQEVRYQVQ